MNWAWNFHCSLLNRLDVKEVFSALLASAHITELTFVIFCSHLPDQNVSSYRARNEFYSSLYSLEVKRVKKWKRYERNEIMGVKKGSKECTKSICKAILMNVVGDGWKLSIIYLLSKMVISAKTLTGQRGANTQEWKTTSNAQ